MTQTQQEEVNLLKELIADTSISADERMIYEDALSELMQSEKPKATTESKPKVTTERKPRTTTQRKTKAPKQSKSDIESAKAEIKRRTGKTEEECESIVNEYRSLRAKSVERKKKESIASADNKERVDKLKKDDKIISGTSEKTADAVIESTTKDVAEKIVKEIDKIEQKAEIEATKEVKKEMPKESTTEQNKAIAEKTEEKVKEIVKTKTKRILIDTSDLLTSIAESLGKFDKDSQKLFLIKLRSDIDKLLAKFSYGGSPTQTFNITQSNMSSSSVNPTMFGGGGGVGSFENNVDYINWQGDNYIEDGALEMEEERYSIIKKYIDFDTINGMVDFDDNINNSLSKSNNYDETIITANLSFYKGEKLVAKLKSFITYNESNDEGLTKETIFFDNDDFVNIQYTYGNTYTGFDPKRVYEKMLQNELQGKKFNEGGGVENGYMVFNYTDNLYASNNVFATKKEANDFIKQFKKRFEQQGYYRDSNMNKIDVEDIDLEIIPSDFNPFRKFNGGGGVDGDIKINDNITIKGNKVMVNGTDGFVNSGTINEWFEDTKKEVQSILNDKDENGEILYKRIAESDNFIYYTLDFEDFNNAKYKISDVLDYYAVHKASGRGGDWEIWNGLSFMPLQDEFKYGKLNYQHPSLKRLMKQDSYYKNNNKFNNGGGVESSKNEKIMLKFREETSDLRNQSYPRMSLSQAIQIATDYMSSYTKEELIEAIKNDKQIEMFGMETTWLNAVKKAKKSKMENGGEVDEEEEYFFDEDDYENN